jgi:hypothetical protein
MTDYKQAKEKTRCFAEWVKVKHSTDKPSIRQSINDYADSISREFDLGEYQKDLLANYVCKLHPKD